MGRAVADGLQVFPCVTQRGRRQVEVVSSVIVAFRVRVIVCIPDVSRWQICIRVATRMYLLVLKRDVILCLQATKKRNIF